ncbi:MAG: tyrosine-type recombinase/integrase [Candidatus Aminicenantes bacterium]|nr:tyrosine-type recombinase/integrase [Candidatus Aminicenantes bacterium]
MNQSLLTVKELSSFLHVHPNTVYKWTDEKKIPFIKINGLVRFKEKQIEDWQDRNESQVYKSPSFLPNLMISLPEFDKMLLKGRSALSKNSKRWNYGFGSVYTRKTKQGKVRWYIDYRNENGERVQKVVKNAQTRDHAVIELREKIAECFMKDHPSQQKTKKVKFSKFAEMYIEDYAKVNKASWKDDEYRISKFAEFFGDIYLDELPPVAIEKFKMERLKQGAEKSTVNRYLTILKRMYNVAIEWGYTKGNPVNAVKSFPKADKLKERILPQDEEERLLEAASAHLKPIIIMALNTGMRRGEILNLKWNDVNLEAKEIKLVKTKSGRSRIVDINSVLLKELSGLLKTGKKQDFVFLNPKTGKPYNKLQTSFDGACRRADIKGLRFHDLRHTFASRLVGKGVDLIKIKEILGHSTVKITERYTHSDRKEKKKAVELLCKKPDKPAEIQENLLHICDTKRNKKNETAVSPFFTVN